MSDHSMANGIAHIHLSALAANYRVMAAAAAPSRCAAVVKANAYGLGVVPVAQRLDQEGCRDFFVADLPEAVELRRACPSIRIFVLDGPRPGDFQTYQQHGLVPVVNNQAQLTRWIEHSRTETVGPVALHVDTGISRLGLSPQTATALAEAQLPDKLEVCLLMTHLACADEPGHPLNQQQLDRFNRIKALFPGVTTSFGNTAGIFQGLEGDLARAGIALYGGNPFSDRSLQLREVVHVEGRVLQDRRVPADTPVGYGATFTTSRDSRLLTVGVGYGDGYLRALGNRGYVCIAGQRAPVVGRVSMDSIVVDATDLDPALVDNAHRVSLLGGGVCMEELAELAGTICYELIARLGPRIVRHYHD